MASASSVGMGSKSIAASCSAVAGSFSDLSVMVGAPPSRCDSDGAGARGCFDVGRALRPFQKARDPRLAHRLLNADAIERASHCLADNDATEQRAVGGGGTAADQLSSDRPFAGFQIGDLRAELAALVGEIAGREIVECGYDRGSLGHG